LIHFDISFYMKSVYGNYHNPFFRGGLPSLLLKSSPSSTMAYCNIFKHSYSNKRREAFTIAEEIYKG
jgi:hypothetical protein